MATPSILVGRKAQTSQGGWRQVCVGGIAAWLAATIIIEVYAALGRAAGLSMMAGAPGAHAAQLVTDGNFALGVFVATFWGTELALLLARFAHRPARTFVVTTVVLAGASLAVPLGAAHTADSTKLFLACGHVIGAAIVIPVLAWQLPRTIHAV